MGVGAIVDTTPRPSVVTVTGRCSLHRESAVTDQNLVLQQAQFAVTTGHFRLSSHGHTTKGLTSMSQPKLFVPSIMMSLRSPRLTIMTATGNQRRAGHPPMLSTVCLAMP